MGIDGEGCRRLPDAQVLERMKKKKKGGRRAECPEWGMEGECHCVLSETNPPWPIRPDLVL